MIQVDKGYSNNHIDKAITFISSDFNCSNITNDLFSPQTNAIKIMGHYSIALYNICHMKLGRNDLKLKYDVYVSTTIHIVTYVLLFINKIYNNIVEYYAETADGSIYKMIQKWVGMCFDIMYIIILWNNIKINRTADRNTFKSYSNAVECVSSKGYDTWLFSMFTIVLCIRRGYVDNLQIVD